ncbi:hypothetical protein [Falsiroseomonas ponticola]|jgi:hypothetical protein|uniref:hypothetical protein n=1 Tax=Falsiroseomonas ponticola TaxID=2786951 RepID=UPI00193172F7|nr:hypothetical protein [Roseomonas ponticola]
MSLDATPSPAAQSEAARRLSAAIDEMRAEVTATRAVLQAVMAEEGAAAGPMAEIAESASRLVGFASGDGAAAAPDDPEAPVPPHPMRRITDWAEGVLHALPPGSHIVTRRRSEQY